MRERGCCERRVLLNQVKVDAKHWVFAVAEVVGVVASSYPVASFLGWACLESSWACVVVGDPAVVGAAVEAAVVGVVLELPQFQVAINLEINVEDLPLLLVVEG